MKNWYYIKRVQTVKHWHDKDVVLCEDCGWTMESAGPGDYKDVRAAAKRHAMEERHRIRHTVTCTSVEEPFEIAETPRLRIPRRLKNLRTGEVQRR